VCSPAVANGLHLLHDHRTVMQPSRVLTPDSRSLDLYLAGPDDGAPLVFFNGTPSAGMIGPAVEQAAAARGMRVISWTRPGYGGSTRLAGRSVADVVADTVTVLDELGVESFHAIGWSGGGPHVLACAALLPDRVRAVATIGGVAPYPAEGLDWTAGMGAENVEEFGYTFAGADALLPRMEKSRAEIVAVTAEEVATFFGDLIDDVDRGSLTGEFAEFVAASFRESVREGYWGWFDEDLAVVQPWGFELGSITVPVHVWQGRHDRMVPFAHGEWLAAHIPTACPHLFEEHGHLTLAVDSLPEILDELTGPA
jgi:pimeloyl-ACP methyl ester carboxylesterase